MRHRLLTDFRCPATVPGLLVAALALAALGRPAPAAAQQPLAQTSVEALVAALRGGPTTRSFRRTQLPDAGTSLCRGQDTQGGAAPDATPAGAGATATRGLSARNLEVVPYAGDTTPGVNLSVQFATGSDRLTPGDQALLNTLALALKTAELAEARFAVAGHTDSTGDARLNLELSCARALAVRRHLVAQGVAVERVSAYGFGSERLLVSDQPAAGVNRRVEVRKAPE